MRKPHVSYNEIMESLILILPLDIEILNVD